MKRRRPCESICTESLPLPEPNPWHPEGHHWERPTPPDTPPSVGSFWRTGPAVRCVPTCRAGTSIEAEVFQIRPQLKDEVGSQRLSYHRMNRRRPNRCGCLSRPCHPEGHRLERPTPPDTPP